MRKLEYSQIVRRKLKELKAELVDKYGDEFASKSIKEMTTALRRLEQFADSGVRTAEMYDIDTDYYYVFVRHNYFIYRIEPQKIIVAQMFNEREDLMMKLFGMSGRTQESIDYWENKNLPSYPSDCVGKDGFFNFYYIS